MYKLIAIDLDGTLLNSQGEISDENRLYLKKAIDRGIEVALASGRPIDSVENLSLEIGANRYLISGNGAVVYGIQEKEILYNKFLSKAQVLNIIKMCKDNSIYCNVYTENEIIAESLNYNILFYYRENANKDEEKRTKINIVNDMYKYIESSQVEKYLKITVCDDSQLIFNSILRKLKTISDVDVLDVSHMSRKIIKDGTERIQIEYFYTEITNRNVNKWEAIKYIIEKDGIAPEEVVGIGDNINDKEMIEYAGLGVAMGNSSPDVKAVAKIVVADNNSDGVAEAIKKYILND